MKFRTLNKWYAKLFGYFWIPCPVCGEAFGGHEWKIEKHRWIPDDAYTGFVICPNCSEKGIGYK